MSNDDKTLVILTPGFPKNEADSVCLPMQQQLVRALKANNPGINITVLTFQYPYHAEEYRWHGIKVISFNGRNKGGISRLLLRKKINAALHKIYYRTPEMALLSFWYGECAWIGHHFAKKNSLKHFCWILGQDAKPGNKYPGRVHLPPDELIALSDFLQNEFEKNHKIKPAQLITPGIDPGLFSESNKSRDIDIIGAGSLIPLKRHDLFIEIVAAIRMRLPGLKVVIVGNGPEKEKLQTLITKSGLDSSVTMTGELCYTDVLQFMQRSKLLLHTSSYEGFSGVCLEALYAGCHVVSFCKAMQTPIEQWQIVSKKEEMIQTALNILENPSVAYNKITFATMDAISRKMLALLF